VQYPRLLLAAAGTGDRLSEVMMEMPVIEAGCITSHCGELQDIRIISYSGCSEISRPSTPRNAPIAETSSKLEDR
jgi:hypothetical protein